MQDNQFKCNEQKLAETLRQLRGVLADSGLTDPERAIVCKDFAAGEESRQTVAMQSMIVLNTLHKLK